MRLNLLAILCVLACVPAFAQTTPPAAGSATMPEGTGKALVQKACVDCHALTIVTSKHASHAEWETLVEQMVSRGAELTDDEVKTVVAYLSKNYGPLDQKPAP